MKTIIKLRTLFLVFSGALLYAPDTMSNVYTVTSTADAGAGSLRAALTSANSNPGLDTIRFQILPAGNLFEGIAGSNYAVIELATILPTITEALLIDGSSQTNTNTGSTAGRTVGVDNIAISAIAYPDVYVVPSAAFVFPTNSTGIGGNGFSIDAPNVSFRGIAISGFGNTNTTGGTASGHADIAVLRAPTPRNAAVTITNCFISCDPRGNFPALAQRRTKGNGILILGHNDVGTITTNYIAHSGTYGIHFNGNTDNLSVGPALTTIGSRNWTINGNQLINITTNSTITVLGRVNDAITLMKCAFVQVINNYIENPEQMGVDLGYNSDSNYVANNTVTLSTKTSAFQLQAGLRIGLCSERDTLIKNVVSDNTGANYKAGIWIDRSTLVQTGVIVKDNSNHRIELNHIYGNTGSGITISNNSSGASYNNIITRNSIHDNTGLGIDLNFNGVAGMISVTPNDDGDVDGGVNNIQNFPLIDSVRRITSTTVGIYGKAPAGSTLEFFVSDGQANSHGGFTLNYGEGETFIGSAVEGSGSDLASGVGSYSIDGSLATNNANMFFVILNDGGAAAVLQNLTATATLGNNTSEFGPLTVVMVSLNSKLINFSANYQDQVVKLNWNAIVDNQFRNFEVEHSTDGKTFSRIANMNPTALDKVSSYEFNHSKATAGKNYYRLKMNNQNALPSYSSVVYVNIEAKSGRGLDNIKTYFTDRIDLKLESAKEEAVAIQLFDQSGKLVRQTQIHSRRGMNFVPLDNLSGLSSGTYVIQVRKETETLSRKLVKL